MKAIMKDGTIVEIDTSFMFNNQYDTTDGMRIHDTQIKQIIDDIRLGEFYCCSVKQGTYEEVQKAIDEERAKINQCEKCFYNQIKDRIEEECSTEKIETVDKIIIHETRVYKKGCTYKAYNNLELKCIHDVEEKPQLFREATKCFFCDHPEGIPDMTDFVKFMIDNHEKYGVVPCWDEDEKEFGKDYAIRFKHKNLFGSYKFEKGWYNNFELSNARNHFKFIYDFKNKTFILIDDIGYEEVKAFTTSEYNPKTQKSHEKLITNFDKFNTWFSAMADDYIKSINQ